MKIIHSKDATPRSGETFTGEVTLERLVESDAPDGMSLSLVHFTDGARTYWHSHPGEQILIVLEGEGRVGTETEQHEIKTGDVVFEPSGERHWHGAMPGKSMTHISVTTKGAPNWYGPPEE